MKTIQKLLVRLVAVGLFPAVASATTSYVYNFAPTAVTGPIVIPVTTLPMFDDNLLGPGEQLLSIAFTLSVTDVVIGNVINSGLSCDGSGCVPGGSLNLVTFGGSAPGSVTGPSGLNESATPSATQSFGGGLTVLNIFSSCVVFSCTVDNSRIVTFNGLTDTQSSSMNISNLPGFFDPFHTPGGGFIGGLNITLGPASVVGIGDPGLSYNATSTMNGTLTVDYTFGVPEPATLALVGCSLLGAVLFRYRKRVANR